MGRPKGSKNKVKTAPIVGFEKEREAWDKAAEQAAADERQGKLRLTDGPREERVELILTRKMSDEEIAHAAVEAAKARAELDRRAKAVEEAKLAHKQHVLGLQNPKGAKTHADLTDIAARRSAEVDSGECQLSTPCRKVIDVRRMTVSYYRLDRGDPEVGELHEERALKDSELKAEPFDPPEVIDVPGDDEADGSDPEE